MLCYVMLCYAMLWYGMVCHPHAALSARGHPRPAPASGQVAQRDGPPRTPRDGLHLLDLRRQVNILDLSSVRVPLLFLRRKGSRARGVLKRGGSVTLRRLLSESSGRATQTTRRRSFICCGWRLSAHTEARHRTQIIARSLELGAGAMVARHVTHRSRGSVRPPVGMAPSAGRAPLRPSVTGRTPHSDSGATSGRPSWLPNLVNRVFGILTSMLLGRFQNF